MKIRILAPAKKGIAKRISAAISAAGGKVEDIRVVREMGGMNEMGIAISVAGVYLEKTVLNSLAEIPGLAILSAPETGSRPADRT